MIVRRSLGASAAILLALGGAPAFAQAAAPAPAATPADPVFEGQKTAFLALPEAERKAIQDSLAWLGFYNGVVDAGFGKRTRDAIIAYQTSIHATVDGVLGPSLVTALTAAAEKPRAAVGFQIVDDAKSGIRYGAPLKLLDKHNGLTLTRADGTITLAIDEKTGADADLGALYAKLTAPNPATKVSYKALKADAFFVVAGVAGGKKFYTRYDQSPDAAKPDLRGFTFSYPEARADLDKVSLAIANSFEPFASAPGAPAPVAIAAPTPPAAPKATPSAKPAPAPVGAGFAGLAFIVGPGRALAMLPASACAHPAIAGKPATYGAETGPPYVLSGDFAPKGAPPTLATAPADDGVVVAFAEATPPRLEASDVKLVAFGDDRAVIAPLGKASAGAPILDRSGALIGLVAVSTVDPPRVGGRLIGAPHAILAAGDIAKVVSGGGAKSSEAMSLGALVKAESDNVVGVTCGP